MYAQWTKKAQTHPTTCGKFFHIFWRLPYLTYFHYNTDAVSSVSFFLIYLPELPQTSCMWPGPCCRWWRPSRWSSATQTWSCLFGDGRLAPSGICNVHQCYSNVLMHYFVQHLQPTRNCCCSDLHNYIRINHRFRSWNVRVVTGEGVRGKFGFFSS